MKKRSCSISRYSEPHVIAELAAHLDNRGVSAIEIATEDGLLTIVSSASARSCVPAAKAAVSKFGGPASETALARAPIAGIFLVAHPLRRDKAIRIGQQVRKGDTVAMIKVGPILVPASAEMDGTVDTFAREPETLVGYGSPLLIAKG